MSPFAEQVRDLFSANGWEGLLEIEDLGSGRIRVKLQDGSLVNEYTEGVSPLEQVQYECLRALRTGRPGS